MSNELIRYRKIDLDIMSGSYKHPAIVWLLILTIRIAVGA
jgi:hypothetical protein